MEKLNLPAFEHKMRFIEGRKHIFDTVRKKFVVLTPEEWVRQHFMHLLIAEGYPKGLLGVESGLKYNKLQKRADIVSYDRQGNPFMLVECKAPHVKLTEDVFQQAAVYNMELKAPFLTITNGLDTYISKIDFEKKNYTFLSSLPTFEEG